MQKRSENKNHSMAGLWVFLGLFLFGFVFTAHGQVDVGLNQVGAELGLGTTDIRVTVANIIRVFLGLLGITTIVLMLYGGFTWMTAGGQQEKLTKAKKTILNSTIGLVIILSSYGIAEFIFSSLGIGFGLGGPGGGIGPGGRAPNFDPGWRGGALGGGIIESHYPGRNASDVPRNTKILITFKEDMNLSSLIVDGDADGQLGSSFQDRISDNIVISRTSEVQNGPFVTNVGIVTQDDRTFILQPDDLLGTPDGNVSYTVRLTGGINKADGRPAFGNFQSYAWEFEVSTFVDTTPPRVTRIVPADQVGDQARNTVVQITFDEAVDPTTVSGAFPPFSNIQVQDAGQAVNGSYVISNQYRTVEFITDEQCGTNSCGGDVFCLPGNANLDVLVRAAAVDPQTGQGAFPYNGVVDLAGNSLDGNEDGQQQGTPDDDVQTSFSTNDEIDLIPPVIEQTNPAKDSANVALTAPATMRFSKLMLASTLTSSNIALFVQDAFNQLQAPDFAYWLSSSSLGNPANKTQVSLNHRDFDPNSTYTVEISSDVKDLRQNCFNPSTGP